MVSVGTGTNTWAKGGVMIRGQPQRRLDPCLHGHHRRRRQRRQLPVSPDDQRRLRQHRCDGGPGGPVLGEDRRESATRITGYLSADGKTWTQQGTPQTITMTDPVLHRDLRVLAPGGRAAHDAVRQHRHDGQRDRRPGKGLRSTPRSTTTRRVCTWWSRTTPARASCRPMRTRRRPPRAPGRSGRSRSAI